ncbi:hypothetical protein NDN08_001226 [Rhodosorus marinus]|uniref:Polynucleotide adenylyltransferase n=1 Tax=Rhodosorus marinus TaxID=101924 RepID=A0AAV8USZ2_9RHOD|nr:hypothetical protein NDN08_001226 [Rhodosorus marinus]
MGLKATGNPARLLAAQAKSRDWTKKGAVGVPGKKVRLIIQSGCFAAVGEGYSNNDAIAHGRNLIWNEQRKFKIRTPRVLEDEQRRTLRKTMREISPRLEQSFSERLRLERVFIELSRTLQKEFGDEGGKIHRFGSMVSGLSLPGGDLDVCLLYSLQAVRRQQLAMKQSLKCMRAMGLVELLPIPRASVPIIKFKHRETGIKGDLSFGTSDGVINSYLLKAYAEVVPGFKNLARFIKWWAKQRGIADASKGYMSSYCWTLLVLFFLQSKQLAGVVDTGPAMTALRQNASRRDKVDSMDWLTGEFQKGLPKMSGNEWQIDQLVDGFFSFYTRHNALGKSVVSTRTGRLIQPQHSRCHVFRNPAFLHVEDPLLEHINVSRHVREETIETLLGEIRRAHQIIRISGDFRKVCAPRRQLAEVKPKRARENKESRDDDEHPPEFEDNNDDEQQHTSLDMPNRSRGSVQGTVAPLM